MARLAFSDRHVQECLRQLAFYDPLFWFQAFMWLQEPRRKHTVIPFCLWPHQTPIILGVEKAIDDALADMENPVDVAMTKARAQGGSYILCGVKVRRWLRDDGFAGAVISKNLDAADNPDDPDSLGSKIDFILSMLPTWMLPRGFSFKKHRSISRHSWVNPETRGSIIAYPATGDVTRGGRKTFVGYDEPDAWDQNEAQEAADSTQYVTNCRVFVSTESLDYGLFHNIVHGETSTRILVLDWKDNPSQTRLLYRYAQGLYIAERLEDQAALNDYVEESKPQLEKLKRRGFFKDGRLRSPWYDAQCLRAAATPRSIAAELDRDPKGAVGRLFNMEVLDRMRKKHVKPPTWEGKVTIHTGEPRFERMEGGPLKLWFEPSLDGDGPGGSYCIGADISTGSDGDHAGNSCLVGCDVSSGEQILEYVDSAIAEARLAYLGISLCRWLNDALLIWEATGPTGKRFATAVVKEIDYPNVYYRDKEGVRDLAKQRKVGWVNTQPAHKADLFEDFWVAMDDGLFLPRSKELVDECGGWEWKDRRVVYRGNTGHGDRSIAGGLCWKGCKDFRQTGLDKEDQKPKTIKYGTLAWHLQQEQLNRFSDDGEETDNLRAALGIRGWQ